MAGTFEIYRPTLKNAVRHAVTRLDCSTLFVNLIAGDSAGSIAIMSVESDTKEAITLTSENKETKEMSKSQSGYEVFLRLSRE